MTFLIVRLKFPISKKASADVLKVEEITYENILKDINFDVKVGDVIGFGREKRCGENNLTKNTHEDYSPYQGKIIENKKICHRRF